MENFINKNSDLTFLAGVVIGSGLWYNDEITRIMERMMVGFIDFVRKWLVFAFGVRQRVPVKSDNGLWIIDGGIKSQKPSSIIHHLSSKKGFTLIELSVVIVIIGLIVAGIVAGQSLVRQAQLRGVVSEVEGFNAAFHVFKLQYDAVPGDFDNATAYWGTGGSGTCPNGLAPTGCNGDGDGKIENSPHEVWRVFQHLSLAGLTEESFTGVEVGGGQYSVPGVNVGKLGLPGGGYSVRFDTMVDGSDGPQIPISGNSMAVGKVDPTVNNSLSRNPIFTAQEVNNLDEKMDDGDHQRGRFLVNGQGCVSSTFPNVVMDLSNTDEDCFFQYVVD